MESNKNNFAQVVSKIDALSPMKTLTRGYSITQKDNKIIKKAADLKKGDNISITFSDGNVNANIL